MSQFSQSFYISDSSFLRLQNQTKPATAGSSFNGSRVLRRSKTDISENEANDKSIEIVDVSPNATTNHQQTMRERVKNASTQIKKKVLRRNKSNLEKTSKPTKKETQEKENVNGIENGNYSVFFESFGTIRSEVERLTTAANPCSVNMSTLMNSNFLQNVTRNSAQPEPAADNFNASDYFKDSFPFEDQEQPQFNSDNLSKYEPDTENEFERAICGDEIIFSPSQPINSNVNELDKTKVDIVLDSSSILFTGDVVLSLAQDSQNDFLENELKKCKKQVKSILSTDPNLSTNNASLLNVSVAMSNQLFDNSPIPSQVPVLPVKTNNFEILQGSPLVIDTSKNLRLISNWGLPSSVLEEYKKKGIVEMFDWQSDCLQNTKVLFENANLVYSAPTSSGKTLVSEILMIKNTLERKKKALFILPFVSVVREKTYYLQDLLISSGIRVDGFFGGYQPPGGFEKTDIAICTIEKANSIVNKLLEHNRLSDVGVIVVDEIHLISDPARGYILELLLAKILYMCRKFDLKIQIITMSATLPNLELLKTWLDAEFYHTDFRPVELKEMIKIGDVVYDNQMQIIRKISEAGLNVSKDQDHIGQLCLETILESCAVIVFCPSKEWCEKLCLHIAELIYTTGKSKTPTGERLRKEIRMEAIEEMKVQLQNCPTGLDSVLEKTISYGCAYHHAGLTTDERDVVESSFKSGILKVIVATSTLSSGVNLPARRVIIRTPLFGGRIMNALTYKQMIGRAGRKGQDTLGESILICTEPQAKFGKELVCAKLAPIASCLDTGSNSNLKRAILEIVASGVAITKSDLKSFTKCTLLCAEKGCTYKFFDDNVEENSKPLEPDPITASMEFLIEYEFIRLQLNDETNEMNYVSTRLGQACLASSMPPGDGFFLFSELQKSRQCFVLESELHAIYLVTPYSVCTQIQEVDWLAFLDLWENLPSAMRRVGELVGVRDSFLVRAMRGNSKLDYKQLQVHKRFYISLALQELVNEASICDVAVKYKCNRGLLQSLQQSASTFAGIVTAFCTSLNWNLLAMIVSQFKERLFFGIHRDLIDLMRITMLSSQRARVLFQNNIKTLVDLANADALTVENVLHNGQSFEINKQLENENAYDAKQRLKLRNYYVTGKQGLTVREAARLLIEEARAFLTVEMGLQAVEWRQQTLSEEAIPKEPVIEDSEDIFKSPPKISPLKRPASDIDSPKVESPPKRRSSSRIAAIKNIEDVPNSQSQSFVCDTPEVKTNKSRTQHSRTLRSRLQTQKPEIQTKNEETPLSIEISSNASINHSIFHHSILMNSSISSPSPEPSDPSALSKLNIIDLCKSKVMFDSFGENVVEVSEISVAIGIAQTAMTQVEQENMIGGNILKTQRQENRPAAQSKERQPEFGIGSGCYIDGLAFCFDVNTVYYLNLQSTGNDPTVTTAVKVERILSMFKMSNKVWKMYDTKEQLKYLTMVLGSEFVDTIVVQDPKVAHWLLNPDAEMTMMDMAQHYAPDSVPLLEYVGQLKYSNMAMMYKSQHSAKHRASIEACVVHHILAEQLEHLKQIGKGYILKAFTDLEMPIQVMLCKMEMAGVSVDRDRLSALSHEISNLMKQAEQKIFQLNGKRFNLNSTNEVAKVLGIHQNLASRTRPSTSKQVLEKIETPMASLIMQYRKLEATLSKTLAPVSRTMSDGKIYGSSFCFTSTGRISMYEPNLQNVAKDFTIQLPGTTSKFISFRSAFRPPAGRCLISVDFCQLELRILTHLSQDRKLVQIMAHSSEDIFRVIAARWNQIPEAEVTESVRHQAKQICYGIIYGMGIKSLADALKTDEQAAQSLSERFHSTYPAIRHYTEKIVKYAREKGYVETLTGRRRYLSQMRSENSSERAQAERQAVNTTIQGSAADISKNAILRVERNLKKYQNELKINTTPANRVDFVLQLHDELIYELPVEKTRQVAKILKHSMENCVQLSIPLRVKIKAGPSWGDLSEIKL